MKQKTLLKMLLIEIILELETEGYHESINDKKQCFSDFSRVLTCPMTINLRSRYTYKYIYLYIYRYIDII